MKKLMILALMMVMTVTANAIVYKDARKEALFLSDKMAYELSLTTDQYEAVYEINLDYLLCLEVEGDLFGTCWERRNDALHLVLSGWQYEKFLALEYFYRPVRWVDDAWVFAIYDHYKRSRFFFDRPRAYKAYKGEYADRPANFYADRIGEKPLSANHNNAPVARDSRPDMPNSGMAPGARPGGFGGRPGGMGPGGMGGRPMGGPGGRR